jgi:CheY-like chemotaxis protein
VLETSIAIAYNEIRHRARLDKHLQDGLAVQGEEARLGQVFVNLLVNAAQAIPAGAASSNQISVATLVRGDSVVVEIRDTGIGIPSELRSKIFEPFFTTRGAEDGTGLGLAISQDIVREHGGAIELESVPGKGSTFRVLLPFHRPRGADEQAADPLPPAPAAERRKRILVIDDDSLVLAAIERSLGREHEVTPLGGAEAAVNHLKTERGYDVILCDLMMPEMTGMAFYDEIAALDPALASRIVFMTGGVFAPEARAFLSRVGSRCLDKPFTRESLRTALKAPGSS